MFFGQAKQLCPSLQAVPYDFHAYKEVARTMYETLARYSKHWSLPRLFFFFYLIVKRVWCSLGVSRPLLLDASLSGALSSVSPIISSSVLRDTLALLRLF